MDLYSMTYGENTTEHKLKKNSQKHPTYEDKSDAIS